MPKPLYKRPAPPPAPLLFERLIYLFRGQKIMLDNDLAALYGVPTKVLNQAVRRNSERFPEDFMFQLLIEEADLLRSQIVTLKRGQHRKYLPFAFTEQGVAMLSSVLRSARAIKVNLEIMRTFVRLRQLLASNADLQRRLSDREQKHDRKFRAVFDAIRELMERPDPIKPAHGREVGFHSVPQLKEEPPPYRCFSLTSGTETTPPQATSQA